MRSRIAEQPQGAAIPAAAHRCAREARARASNHIGRRNAGHGGNGDAEDTPGSHERDSFLRAMAGDELHAVDRFMPETRAQMLDELGDSRPCSATVLTRLPE